MYIMILTCIHQVIIYSIYGSSFVTKIQILGFPINNLGIYPLLFTLVLLCFIYAILKSTCSWGYFYRH